MRKTQLTTFLRDYQPEETPLNLMKKAKGKCGKLVKDMIKKINERYLVSVLKPLNEQS